MEQTETIELTREEQVYEGRKVQAENMRLKKRVMQLEQENTDLKRFIGGM